MLYRIKYLKMFHKSAEVSQVRGLISKINKYIKKICGVAGMLRYIKRYF